MTFSSLVDNKMADRRDLGFLPVHFAQTMSINKSRVRRMKRQKMMIFFLLHVLYMNKVREYNNLNRTAGKMDEMHDRVPSTNTEIVRHLEVGLARSSVAGQD